MNHPAQKMLPIGHIKKNESNPRIIKDVKFRKLVNSIKEFPQMMYIRPIVVDANNVILGGNQRYEACKTLKWKEVPVLIADDLTPEEQKHFIIADNASAGEWDWDILANDWSAGDLEAWGVDIPLMTTLDELEDEEQPQQGTFPLSITLNIIEFKKWQNYKKEAGFRSDTDAFKETVLKLIEN
jgi:ParB-like chromosome segregation protein Spo0J